MVTNCLHADGFEIFLTGNKTELETKTEATELDQLVSWINPRAEIRYVLGSQVRSETEILQICKGLIGLHAPSFIRTDIQLKLQVSKGNSEAHTELFDKIRLIIDYPIKASGNFGTIKALAACPWASRFAVSLPQLRTILNDLNRQPNCLREMLE